VTEFRIVVILLSWRWIHQCTYWRQLCCLELVGCYETKVRASDTLRSV